MLTNPVFLRGYLHVLLASLVTAATVMLAVAAWQMRRGGNADVFAPAARLALVVLVPALFFAMIVGSELGVTEDKYQPMKIAGSEAQWQTCQPCSFSLFQIGGGNKDETPTKIIEIPHLLSLLATNSWNGQVQGLNSVQKQYDQAVREGAVRAQRLHPVLGDAGDGLHGRGAVPVLALGSVAACARRPCGTSTWFLRIAVWAAVLPFVINTAGWVLTENGRQPWIVQGIQLTKDGVSPSVSTWEVGVQHHRVLPAVRRPRRWSTSS